MYNPLVWLKAHILMRNSVNGSTTSFYKNVSMILRSVWKTQSGSVWDSKTISLWLYMRNINRCDGLLTSTWRTESLGLYCWPHSLKVWLDFRGGRFHDVTPTATYRDIHSFCLVRQLPKVSHPVTHLAVFYYEGDKHNDEWSLKQRLMAPNLFWT